MDRINRKRALSSERKHESQLEASKENPVYAKKIPRHEKPEVYSPQLSNRNISDLQPSFFEKECILFPKKTIELSAFKAKPTNGASKKENIIFEHGVISGKLNKNKLEALDSKLKKIQDKVRKTDQDFAKDLTKWLMTEIEDYEGEYTEIDVSLAGELYALAFILPSSEKGKNKLLLLIAKQQEYRGAGTYCLAACINEYLQKVKV